MSLLRDEKESYGRDQSPGPRMAPTRVLGQRPTEQNMEGQGCAVSVWSAPAQFIGRVWSSPGESPGRPAGGEQDFSFSTCLHSSTSQALV